MSRSGPWCRSIRRAVHANGLSIRDLHVIDRSGDSRWVSKMALSNRNTMMFCTVLCKVVIDAVKSILVQYAFNFAVQRFGDSRSCPKGFSMITRPSVFSGAKGGRSQGVDDRPKELGEVAR